MGVSGRIRKWIAAWMAGCMLAAAGSPVRAEEPASGSQAAAEIVSQTELAGTQTELTGTQTEPTGTQTELTGTQTEPTGMQTEPTGTQTEAEAEGRFSILVIGSDRRGSEGYGNSDVMLLMEVNHDAKEIVLLSFMRDLYADIPGYGVSKLNAAYPIGGAELLLETLETNYGVTPDHYIAVDFASTAHIIDLLGGVDMEIREDEIDVTNEYYIKVMCEEFGLDPGEYYLTHSGMQRLNGLQAVGFARNRFSGDNDYERTQRQRRIVAALMESIGAEDVPRLPELAAEIYSETDHDLTAADFLSLLMTGLAARSYEIVTGRVPFDGTFYSENEILTPYNMEETRQMISSLLE